MLGKMVHIATDS